LDYVRPRYEARWPVRIVVMDAEAHAKARAVNEAARTSDADVLILADADCWCEGIPLAVEAVERGAAWAIPHRHVHRLTHDATRAVLSGEPLKGKALVQPPYVGIKGGGIVVVRREVLLDVPWDERYRGWGREDRSWRNAMTTLYPDVWRGRAPLYHLWHPPAPRKGRVVSLSSESEALYARYEAARGDAAAIRELLKGARCAPSL
jgi:hypothetical protein